MKKESKAVLDASAILALIQGERGEEKLRPLLPRAAVCSVNVAEVLAKLIRDGMPRDAAAAALAALHVEEISFDGADAQRSAAYVAKGISLGDRCFLAAAFRHGEGFTSDAEFSKLIPDGPRLHGFR